MLRGSKLVALSGGTVVLREWGDHVMDAHLHDLLTFTVTLGAIREEWGRYKRTDLDSDIWDAFWRLVRASLDGCELPKRLTWDDRHALLEAMWELNQGDQIEKRWEALSLKAQERLMWIQGQMTPTMSS